MTKRAKIAAELEVARLCLAFTVLACSCSKTHSAQPVAPHAMRRGSAGQSASAGQNANTGMDAGSIAEGGAASDATGAAGRGGADAGAAGGSAPVSDAGRTHGDAGSTQSQPRTCANAWYRCRDVCTSMTLAGGGRSFGQCSGECSFELTMYGAARLEGNGDCSAVSLSLIVRTSDNRVLNFTVALSEQAWEQFADISRALAGMPLALMTGCPDCADGRIASVTLLGADRSKQDYSYAYGKPPAALRDADAFVQALIDQLRACKGPMIDKCSASVATNDPDAPPSTGSDCAFTYEDTQSRSAVQCSFPVNIAAPCREAVRCLCSTNVLNPGGGDPQGCVDSWFTPRGAPTFADFCTSGAASPTRSLGDALREYAHTYQGTVKVLAPECDKVPAVY